VLASVWSAIWSAQKVISFKRCSLDVAAWASEAWTLAGEAARSLPLFTG